MDVDDDHHKTYNINGKIMITSIISLAFVVLLVILLHLYVRCVLRRQTRRQAALRQLALYTISIDPPKTGLDPTVIASLPIFTFKKDDSRNGTTSTECAVCLSMIEDGELIRVLPNCKHNFHAECIDKWLSTNSTCPICRTEAEPRLVSGELVAGVPPTAPPIDEGTSEGSLHSSVKINGPSSSRLSSFRKMLSRDRSSQRIQSCTQENGLEDLERQ